MGFVCVRFSVEAWHLWGKDDKGSLQIVLLLPQSGSALGGFGMIGLEPIQGNHTGCNQQSSGPEPPGGGIMEECDPCYSGKYHFGGHEDPAFPSPAIEKALIHQQLSGNRGQYDAKDHRPFHERRRENRLLDEFGQGHKRAYGAEIQIDDDRAIVCSQTSD